MLFSHRESEVREEAQISGMKVGQLPGHSCLRIWCPSSSGVGSEPEQERGPTWTRMRLTLLMKPFCVRSRLSSLPTFKT